jgi:hypothetical protein
MSTFFRMPSTGENIHPRQAELPDRQNSLTGRTP